MSVRLAGLHALMGRRKHNVVDSTGVRIMAELCATCIFRPGNKMQLHPDRVQGMVADALSREGGTIVCHETLDHREHAVCRGFFNRHKNDVALLQIAERMGVVVWHRP